MSDWIHCNKCFKQPVPNGPKFHLTNCGHFICELCTAGKPGHCFKCESSCSTVTLSQNLDEDIRSYFINIDDQYDQIHKLLKTMMFQKNHRESLFVHLCKENKRYSKELQEVNNKYAVAKKFIKQTLDENKRMREILKNMASKTPTSNQRATKNNSFMNTEGTTITFLSKKSNENRNFENTSLKSNYFQTPNTSEITFKSLFFEKNIHNR